MAYSLRGSNLSHKKPDSNFGFVAYIMGVGCLGAACIGFGLWYHKETSNNTK